VNKTPGNIISIPAAIIMMLGGILVITGWLTRNDFLMRVLQGQNGVEFNVAVCFALSSAVIFLHLRSERNTLPILASLISAFIFLIGLLTFCEFVFTINFGIDSIFIADHANANPAYRIVRMPPLSAVNFMFTAICLFFLNRRESSTYQFYYLLSVAFISLLMFVGLIFIPDIPDFINLSSYTAMGFIIQVLAIYFAQPMLQKKINFQRKLFTGFNAVIILISVLSIFSFYYSDKRISTSHLVEHTNVVLGEADEILSLIKDIESGGRGYVITGDSAYLKYFTIAKDAIFSHVKKLKDLTKDNASQQTRADTLFSLVAKRISFSLQCIQIRNKNGFEEAGKLMTTDFGRFYTDKIRNVTAEIQQEENSLLAARRKENEKSILAFNYAFIILLAAVFLLLAIILLSIRNNIAIRKKAEAALTKMNNKLELKVKERTAKLASSEERFRSIIEQYPSPVIRYSPDGTLISVNPAWEIMWEDKRENVVGYNIRRDPQMIASGLSKVVEKAFAGKVASSEIYQYDPAIIGKTGRKRWMQMLIYPLKDSEGQILEVILITPDMTENKEAQEKLIASEKQFRDTLDSMLEGAQIIGFDWKYKYVNDSMAKHGKYSKEELIGHTVMEKYPGIEETEIFKYYQKCFNERVAIHLENEFIFPDNTKGWFELSFQPVSEGIFILSIDITERKKAEFEIQKLNEHLEEKVMDRTKKLETANRELESFSYSVSHDLRAPLRAINGFAKILADTYETKLDEEGKRLLTRVEENAKKMGLLIDDLLEFSRLGRKEIHKSPIKMKELFEASIAEVNTLFPNKATIKTHEIYSSDADIAMIKQVIINILANAVKYSSKSENPAIDIRSYHSEDEIIYSVSDNGIGFNNLYVHKLFGVFQRLHLQSDYDGTGVGLALVKRIIDKHGGRVWATGELNKGATFFFSLPVNNVQLNRSEN